MPFHYSVQFIISVLSFFGLVKLRILNIFFKFSMSWNAEGKKFQICMKCSIFTQMCQIDKKQKNSTTFALQRNFHIYKWMLFHCRHVKSKESLCYGFKCTFVHKVARDSRVEMPEPALLYSVCCFTNSEQPVGIWPDFILCVCVTHFAKEGRRSVGKKRPTQKDPRLRAVKTETYLQVQSMDLQEHRMSQAGSLFPESLPV